MRATQEEELLRLLRLLKQAPQVVEALFHTLLHAAAGWLIVAPAFREVGLRDEAVLAVMGVFVIQILSRGTGARGKFFPCLRPQMRWHGERPALLHVVERLPRDEDNAELREARSYLQA